MVEKKQKPLKTKAKTHRDKAAKKPSNDQPDYWLNKRQVCDSLGITATAFDKWKVAPVARVGNCNYYDLRSLVDNRIEAVLRRQQLEHPAPSSGEKLDPVQEHARLAKEKADDQALKNAKGRAEQIPAEAAALIFGRVAAEMAAILDSLEANIKRRVPSLTATELGFIKAERVRLQNLAASVGSRLEEFIDELIGAPEPGD
ncbi:terminase small subunit [uncultured Microbulbifer sp.]|uniref:terminase small subunit n=1 Tax=uncultured Microbulbifer sp. TaxID=348147 RepID=UPI0026173BCD|nr:terminase small subunit [uncultured Microbulbifer sp.]